MHGQKLQVLNHFPYAGTKFEGKEQYTKQY